MKPIEYVLIGILAALLIPKALADSTGTVTIDVNISEAASISVSPSALEFLLVAPGLDPFPATRQIDVTNTGSVNFTTLTTNMNSFSVEDSNPYDNTGDPTAYSAGSFVVMLNSSMTDKHRFLNRMDWNYTKGWISGMVGIANVKSWGWFYNHSVSYLWNMAPGANGYCNASDATITVKRTKDSPSANKNMGTDVDSGTNSANNTDWSVYTFASTSPWSQYCVATYVDCTKLMVYQYFPGSAAAVGSTTLPNCGAGRYLKQSSGLADSKFPAGDTYSFNITVFVPKGVPAGNVSQSTMTVTAA